MCSLVSPNKPHAVCIPFPAQGHINPMLKLAKLLYHRGFHITFVNTEFNHRRLLKSRGPDALYGLPSFRFETIPDGLPPSDVDATQDVPSLCESTARNCLAPFKELLCKLNDAVSGVPPVSCIVSDGIMSFTLDAAQELGIPDVLLWTCSSGGFLGYAHYRDLIEKRYIPLKDESSLNTVIDWIPEMEGIKLKDLPSFIRPGDGNSKVFNFAVNEVERAKKASAIVTNTFDALDHEIITTLSSTLAPVIPVGPLHLLLNKIEDNDLNQIETNLWREEAECLKWLDLQDPDSVVYVNFGSVTVMSPDQLVEFAWGLANSEKPFLWIIRPDLVTGEAAILPAGFVEETKNRCMLATWCPQEKVLSHVAVGGFLTHSGWNSTLESVAAGVPVICWPFFGEQQTNCWFCCEKWGIGMEIDGDVKRGEVEKQVRELMEGEKGEEMRRKAEEWKMAAEAAAASPSGSSYENLEKVIDQVLLAQGNSFGRMEQHFGSEQRKYDI